MGWRTAYTKLRKRRRKEWSIAYSLLCAIAVVCMASRHSQKYNMLHLKENIFVFNELKFPTWVRSNTKSLVRLVVLLAIAWSRSLQADQGWIVSRANCVNNESITWHTTSELRRTASRHWDRLVAESHVVLSSSSFVDERHSGAIHVGEGVPTLLIHHVPIFSRCDPLFFATQHCARIYVPVPVLWFDRWSVQGNHEEIIDDELVIRTTAATDCNFS